MAKGDSVKVLLDIGGGNVIERIVSADKAGRSVSWERDDRKGIYTVEVIGRAGTPARTVDFRLDRVIMIEMVPA
jgi:hypothetical protein